MHLFVTLGGAHDGGGDAPVGLQGHMICGRGRYADSSKGVDY